MKRRKEATAVTRRSQARMLALQALCAFEAIGDEFGQQLGEFFADEQVLADLDIDPPAPAELRRFASALARGAWAQRRVLDEKLAQTAAHWSLARMTPVDRNVLRLGLHELLEHPETPPQVVINEAIELARHFGNADSPAFVNGVLDAVRRACQISSEPPADSSVEAATPPRSADDTKGEHGTV